MALALVEETRIAVGNFTLPTYAAPKRPTPLPPRLDASQLAAHLALIKTLGAAAIWGDYREASQAL